MSHLPSESNKSPVITSVWTFEITLSFFPPSPGIAEYRIISLLWLIAITLLFGDITILKCTSDQF